MGIFGSNKDRETKKPDFSNVRGDSSSTAPPGGARAASAARTYVVQKGDSLSKIAQREYGDADAWRRIYDANRDQIKDPDLIYPGQNLSIPPA